MLSKQMEGHQKTFLLLGGEYNICYLFIPTCLLVTIYCYLLKYVLVHDFALSDEHSWKAIQLI